MFRFNIYHKTRQSPLKLEILLANTALSGNLFQKFMARLWNIIFSIWFFFSLQLFPHQPYSFVFVYCRSWQEATYITCTSFAYMVYL